MKRAKGFVSVLALVLCLCLFWKDNGELSDVGGVDMSGGEVVSSEDTHGGFHGDGYKLVQVRYAAGAVQEEIAASEDWRSLPLTGALHTFVYQPYDTRLLIPEIESGYYWFYDRHSESVDHRSDAGLLSRYSFNFTLAIYDSDADILYFCIYDT